MFTSVHHSNLDQVKFGESKNKTRVSRLESASLRRKRRPCKTHLFACTFRIVSKIHPQLSHKARLNEFQKKLF